MFRTILRGGKELSPRGHLLTGTKAAWPLVRELRPRGHLLSIELRPRGHFKGTKAARPVCVHGTKAVRPVCVHGTKAARPLLRELRPRVQFVYMELRPRGHFVWVCQLCELSRLLNFYSFLLVYVTIRVRNVSFFFIKNFFSETKKHIIRTVGMCSNLFF